MPWERPWAQPCLLSPSPPAPSLLSLLVASSPRRVTEDKVCTEDEFFSGMDFCGETMLVGDCAEELKASRFADNDHVMAAPKNSVLQRASSLCAALEDDIGLLCSADDLSVSYLQATKAEKDKAHRDS